MKGKNTRNTCCPHSEPYRAVGPKGILTNACTQSRGATVRNQWAENKQLAPEFLQECCGKRAKFHPGASLPHNSIISHQYGHAGLTSYKVEIQSLELLYLPVSHFPVGSSEPSSNYLIWGIASFPPTPKSTCTSTSLVKLLILLQPFTLK